MMSSKSLWAYHTRMTLARRALLLALLAALTPLAPAQAQRLALVIGNAAYRQAPALANPGHDAEAIADALTRTGFQVTLHRDLGLAAMRGALRDFADAARGAETALFYFAGHGLQIGRADRAENFLIPTDARLADLRDVEDETLSLTRILEWLDGAESRIVILDACRDNPLAQRLVAPGGTRGLARGLAIPERMTQGTLLAFATAPGATAADGAGRNSPFAAALIEHLPTPGLELRQLLTRVRQRVVQQTGGAQVPWTNDGLLQEIYLAGPGNARPTLETLEQTFWQSIAGSRNATDFEAYLARYPQGLFAALATNRLADLRAEPPGPEPVARPLPGPRAPPAPPRTGAYPVRPGQHFRDRPDTPELTVIPAGSFTLGSPPTERGRASDEGPQRSVTVAAPLAIGRTPVTVAQYRRFVEATRHGDGGWCMVFENSQWVMQNNRSWLAPGFAQTEEDPVVCVTWEDAQAYAAWLSAETGQRYRLPTEAEWEYAARAGTSTAFWWGNDPGAACRHANGADQTTRAALRGATAWALAACRDGFATTAPVGRFPANGFGLLDMAGNVFQWTQDCYADSYRAARGDAATPITAQACAAHVTRGGAWNFDPNWLRAAARGRDAPLHRSSFIGFRIARSP